MRDELERAAADLAAAPFEPGRWVAALDGMALAGGGWAAQLLIGSPKGYVLDMTPRMPADGRAEAQSFGLDPNDQPRSRIALAPLMQVRGDDDLATAEEQARSGFYAFMRRHDVPYACLAHVDQIGEDAVLVTALRSARAGHIQEDDRARFGALLPHLRAAVRLQLKLEEGGARLALGMMGAVGQAAAVCDAHGRIVAATPAAEAALEDGVFVTARGGLLAGAEAASDRALALALARAGGGPTLQRPAASRVRLHERTRRRWIEAEVAPVPPELAAFRVQAAVMVLLGLERPAEDRAARLIRLHGLTAAEAEVALALAAGETVAAIAERRGVRLSTLRSQLAAILAKTGTARQAELVGLVLRTA